MLVTKGLWASKPKSWMAGMTNKKSKNGKKELEKEDEKFYHPLITNGEIMFTYLEKANYPRSDT